MAKKKTEEVKVVEPKVIGAVYYTDGGCRPNPGWAGFGIHGYTYLDQPAKKGAGYATHIVSSQGYLKKKDYKGKAVDVNVSNYLDIYGTINGLATNNLAELAAAKVAISHANELGVRDVTLITDSKFTINCIDTWIDNWKENGWVKSDGKPLPNPLPYQQIAATIDKFKSSGGTISCGWVEGHKGHAGNTQADILATFGVKTAYENCPNKSTLSSATLDDIEIVVDVKSPPEKYHKPEIEKPNMLFLPVCLFHAKKDAMSSSGYYFCSNHKDVTSYGNKTADASFGYYEPKNKSKLSLLNHVLEFHIHNKTTYDKLIRVHIDEVYNSKNQQLIESFGDIAYKVRKPNSSNKRTKLSVSLENGSVLSTEFDPVRKAMVAFEHACELRGLLTVINDEDIIKTDVTDCFYDTKDNKKTLKSSLGSGVNTIKLKYHYRTPSHKDNSVSSTTFRLDTDFPSRNQLKHLEELNPKIYIVTWAEGVKSYRYGSMIVTDEGTYIMAAVHSNLRVVV